MTPKRVTGTQHYKKQGLKALIVHISAKDHGTLTSLARLDRRSLQLVARAILEHAAEDPEKTLKTVNDYIRASAKEG